MGEVAQTRGFESFRGTFIMVLKSLSLCNTDASVTWITVVGQKSIFVPWSICISGRMMLPTFLKRPHPVLVERPDKYIGFHLGSNLWFPWEVYGYQISNRGQCTNFLVVSEYSDNLHVHDLIHPSKIWDEGNCWLERRPWMVSHLRERDECQIYTWMKFWIKPWL